VRERDEPRAAHVCCAVEGVALVALTSKGIAERRPATRDPLELRPPDQAIISSFSCSRERIVMTSACETRCELAVP
jgi:hypothetical protein